MVLNFLLVEKDFMSLEKLIIVSISPLKPGLEGLLLPVSAKWLK